MSEMVMASSANVGIDRTALQTWLESLIANIDDEPIDESYDEGYAQGYAGAIKDVLLYLQRHTLSPKPDPTDTDLTRALTAFQRELAGDGDLYSCLKAAIVAANTPSSTDTE